MISLTDPKQSILYKDDEEVNYKNQKVVVASVEDICS